MPSEFRAGWKVVLASAIGIGAGVSPIPFYSIGVFVRPLATEFGWTVDQILLTLAVLTVGVVLFAPVVGLIVDRVGVRRVVLVSIVVFGLSLMLPALCGGSLPAFYAAYAVMAFAGAGTLPITFTRAVNTWFVRQRGLALGLSLIATGLFGTLVKYYANWLVGLVGWRGAYVGLAAFPLLLALPVAAVLFRDAPDRAMGEPEPAPRTGLSFGEGVRTWRFWILAAAFLPVSFVLGGIVPNLEKLFASKGFDAGTAVSLTSMIGIAVTVGRPLGGWLLDRFWPPAVAFAMLAAPTAAFLTLAQAGDSWNAALFSVLLIGVALGVEYDLIAFLVARYFGLRAYAALYGCIYSAFGLGAGFGPFLLGRAYVRDGSYDPVLTIGAMVLLASSALLLLLGRSPRFEGQPGPTTSTRLPSGARNVPETAPP